MKTKILNIGCTVFLAVITSVNVSCSSDEGDPLYDDAGEAVEIDYTWSETADSLQEATYNTFLYAEGTFKQDNQGNTNFNYWWNAHMLDALVDGYLRTKDEHYISKMKALVRGIKTRNGGKYQNVFNDDMEWLGIACLRAYEATKDEEYKEVATLLWTEVKKGWSDVHGGGITWRTDTPNGKNACSNGPAAIFALKFYQIDNNPDDLEWAKKIYAWEKATLVDPETGLVWDNIDVKDGETVINKDWILTYNQGTFIGAAAELYSITNDRTYLNDAIKTSKSIMTSPKVTSEGLLRNENQGDGGLFKGILARYFALFVQEPDLSKTERDKFIKFFRYNAETFYENGISRPSMMCSPDWSKQPGVSTDLSTQLSGVMLMEAAAQLEKQDIL